uniref:UNC80 domain-containing protein n=1 Tax=Macrostomum lignano TaxID=282301 RepID=A0A1I8HTK9_9PLAT
MQELVDILHAFTGFCMDPAPLYSDVRNLLNYLREVHGCTFRRTLLTGLLDCIQRRRKNRRDSNGAAAGNVDRPSRVSVASDNSDGGETAATKSPTSRAPSVTSESHRGAAQRGAQRGGRCDRRSLSPFFIAAATTSDSEGLNDRLGSPGSSDAEESPCRRRGGSGGVPSHRRKGFKSDTDDDSDKQNQRKKMSFRAAGQATLNFLTAKKRLEETIRDRVRRSMLKRERSFDELPPGVLSADASLQSAGMGGPGGGAGASVMRQRRIINCQLLHSGMSLFRFLLDSCHPGVVPEPQLVAAMLDLEAPVVARACVLLECANFVQRCGKGDWPTWMRSWGPGCKPKRTMAMQRMAGHLFHAWAETLGSRLEYFLKIEVATDRFGSVQEVQDDARRRALQREDEMENFLVDSTVNESGDACPHALKAVAVTLLLEITHFLRDVFPNLPKPKSVSSNRGGRGGGGAGGAESGRNCRPISDEPTSSVGSNVQEFASEELPSAVHPNSGHQAAGHTVSSAATVAGPRRISFAVPPTASSHSHASGTAAHPTVTPVASSATAAAGGAAAAAAAAAVTSLEVRLTVP